MIGGWLIYILSFFLSTITIAVISSKSILIFPPAFLCCASAYILENLTPRSLVIVDELGRGTSNIDGVSLAFAIAERLAVAATGGLSPYTLFVTHYPQLTALADMYPNVANVHLRTSIDVQAMTALAATAASAVTAARQGLGQGPGSGLGQDSAGGGTGADQQQQQQHIKFLHQVSDRVPDRLLPLSLSSYLFTHTHSHTHTFFVVCYFLFCCLLQVGTGPCDMKSGYGLLMAEAAGEWGSGFDCITPSIAYYNPSIVYYNPLYNIT